MEGKPSVKGLYLVSDARYTGKGHFFRIIEECFKAGVNVFQYRDETERYEERVRMARKLREMTRQYGLPFLINNYATLTEEVGADGVHIGSEDTSIEVLRKALGDKAILGVSVHGSLELAKKMEEMGADYVAFGSCFKSPTKPQAPVISLSILREAKQVLKIPVVAIGGITPKNVKMVLETGVDAVAVISGILASPHPARAVRLFKEALASLTPTHETQREGR